MRQLAAATTSSFRRTVYGFYRKNRRDFPWRRTKDPYCILVSELMLQQTQAPRVVAKYEAFIKTFPDVNTLARAPLKKVLAAWSGLGYNRRAKLLQQAAQTIVAQHGGTVPDSVDELRQLPGAGPYTAAAVAAFAFNQPTVLLETNVRAVLLHHFSPRSRRVSDQTLLPLVEQTLDRKNPRQWYSALMDYGTMLKITQPNPSRRSRHYLKQSQFAGSNRQLRGSLLKVLISRNNQTASQLRQSSDNFTQQQVDAALKQLVAEGLITRRGLRYQL